MVNYLHPPLLHVSIFIYRWMIGWPCSPLASNLCILLINTTWSYDLFFTLVVDIVILCTKTSLYHAISNLLVFVSLLLLIGSWCSSPILFLIIHMIYVILSNTYLQIGEVNLHHTVKWVHWLPIKNTKPKIQKHVVSLRIEIEWISLPTSNLTYTISLCLHGHSHLEN